MISRGFTHFYRWERFGFDYWKRRDLRLFDALKDAKHKKGAWKIIPSSLSFYLNLTQNKQTTEHQCFIVC